MGRRAGKARGGGAARSGRLRRRSRDAEPHGHAPRPRQSHARGSRRRCPRRSRRRGRPADRQRPRRRPAAERRAGARGGRGQGRGAGSSLGVPGRLQDAGRRGGGVRAHPGGREPHRHEHRQAAQHPPVGRQHGHGPHAHRPADRRARLWVGVHLLRDGTHPAGGPGRRCHAELPHHLPGGRRGVEGQRGQSPRRQGAAVGRRAAARHPLGTGHRAGSDRGRRRGPGPAPSGDAGPLANATGLLVRRNRARRRRHAADRLADLQAAPQYQLPEVRLPHLPGVRHEAGGGAGVAREMSRMPLRRRARPSAPLPRRPSAG